MTRHLHIVPALLAATLVGCGISPSQDPETVAARLAQINLQLGVGYMQEGKYQLALDRLRKAVNADPSSVDARLSIAMLYDRLGQDEAADINFREALRLAPENGSVHTNYGSYLCRVGRVPEAEEHFRQAASTRGYENPEFALTNAGLCLIRHGSPEKAEVYLKQALERSPAFPPALIALAEQQAASGQFQAARDYLKRYHDTTPPGPQSLSLAVRVETALGDKAAARTYAELLRTRYPDASADLLRPAAKPRR